MQTSVTIFSYLKWVHLPTGTGQHLGGKCWGIFGKASRLDVKNICVCMKVLCLTFCHCPAHKLPVHCDWDGWLVGDSLRQFKLRKPYEKWLFKIKVSCLVFFKFYTLQESSVEGEILNPYIILNQWLFSHILPEYLLLPSAVRSWALDWMAHSACYHGIIGWFLLEGTLKCPLVPAPSCCHASVITRTFSGSAAMESDFQIT